MLGYCDYATYVWDVIISFRAVHDICPPACTCAICIGHLSCKSPHPVNAQQRKPQKYEGRTLCTRIKQCRIIVF